MKTQYHDVMETTADIWVAACAHALQRHWRTVDPMQLEEIAEQLRHDEKLRNLTPSEAAQTWLKSVVTTHA